GCSARRLQVTAWSMKGARCDRLTTARCRPAIRSQSGSRQPKAGGMQRGRAAGPLAKMARWHRAHLVFLTNGLFLYYPASTIKEALTILNEPETGRMTIDTSACAHWSNSGHANIRALAGRSPARGFFIMMDSGEGIRLPVRRCNPTARRPPGTQRQSVSAIVR